MVKLTIDHIATEAREGATIMEAAAQLGISIPSMCHSPGFHNHPSCMVCLVRDADRKTLVPSCAMPVSEGMNILTNEPDIIYARQDALELLLSDHSGDCEAPCRLTCPAFMDIPLMNRLIAAGDFNKALRVVREEIALPLVLGYICPAPCEKACKRKPIDQAVSICLLKRSSATFEAEEYQDFRAAHLQTGKKVAIIGTGPAGLAAAFYLLRMGHSCVLFDQNEQPGGALRYEIPEDMLPKSALDADIELIRRSGAEFRMGGLITADLLKNGLIPAFDAVILATGNVSKYPGILPLLHPDTHGSYINRDHFTTRLQGVFACGNILREQKMAVQAIAQGKAAAGKVAEFLRSGVFPSFEKYGSDQAKEHNSRSLSVTGLLMESEWPEYLKESNRDRRYEPAAGKQAGFSREEAMAEAKRCMHCDCRKPASCKLRQYGDLYHARRKRFPGVDRNPVTKVIQHEQVIYEPEKCIRCGLCVEITVSRGERFGLAYAGRGFDVRITVPFSEPVQNGLTDTARECAEACPTGAISLRNQEEREPT
jgi:ferredoxin